jgi:cell division protein ZapB
MSKQETNDQAELDLKKLEVRVEELIRACSSLKDENKSLRISQDNLVAERAALIEKTELARARVEAMITRLKAMEASQ